MVMQLYATVLNFFFGLLIWFIALRMWLQLVRAPFNNAFVQSLYRMLSPMLGPLERVIPKFRNLNLACLAVIMLLGLVWAQLLLLTWSLSVLPLAALLLLTALYYQWMALLIIYALASFLEPRRDNPMFQVIGYLVVPFVRPFKKLIPPVGPLDLSIAFAMLSLSLAHIVLQAGLQAVIESMV